MRLELIHTTHNSCPSTGICRRIQNHEHDSPGTFVITDFLLSFVNKHTKIHFILVG